MYRTTSFGFSFVTAIFSCAVPWHSVPSHCSATITTAHLHSSFSSCKTETLHLLNNNSPRPLPQALAAALLLSVSMGLMTLVTPCKWNHTALVLCYWLISLSIMSSSFICVAARIRISFPFKAELYSTICIWHVLFIQSSITGRLCCLYLLAIVNMLL